MIGFVAVLNNTLFYVVNFFRMTLSKWLNIVPPCMPRTRKSFSHTWCITEATTTINRLMM